MKALNEVMTFKEANDELGKHHQHINYLINAGKLVEGVDYRKAGRIGLITREAVERLKK